MVVSVFAAILVVIAVSAYEIYVSESLIARIRRKKNAKNNDSDVLIAVCRCALCAHRRKN